ncbi:MAG TPA: hypothetical protein VHB99_11575 [Pirellulales bacterium]|nr:hypothetical protein [Pirellulales bacterium]
MAQRKRGAVVHCPKCGHPNVVPHDPSAAEDEAASAPPQPSAAEPQFPNVVVFDDVPELIAEQERKPIQIVKASLSGPAPPVPPASNPAIGPPTQPAPTIQPAGPPPLPPFPWSNPAEPPAAAAARTSEAIARLKPRPEDALLLLSRRAVYALAGLLLAVSLFAFLAGYLIGRGRRSAAPGAAAEQAAAEVDPVALEGSMIFSAAPGQFKPDVGAVAIALPIDKTPAEKLPAAGLRAGEAEESHWAPLANALASFGGALARANDDGDFQLVVPQPGDYYLLLISRHAKRPAAKAIDKDDLSQLASYFADGAGLIGPDKYVLVRRRLSGVPAPLNQDFGADGK